MIRGQERDNWITDVDIEIDYPAPEYEKTERIKPHLRNVKFLRKDEKDWFAPQVFSRAIRWVQHDASHKNFFLMIDSFDPHELWDPPRYYTNLYDDPNYDGYEYVAPSYRPIEGYLSETEFMLGITETVPPTKRNISYMIIINMVLKYGKYPIRS